MKLLYVKVFLKFYRIKSHSKAFIFSKQGQSHHRINMGDWNKNKKIHLHALEVRPSKYFWKKKIKIFIIQLLTCFSDILK